jgi:endogenous inhibitor of DNA gyrase (YacG/DUF329 family)
MDAMTGPKVAVTSPCPVCGRPAQPRFQPFCTSRCADVDLGRWFAGSYRIAGEMAVVPEGEGEKDDEAG